MAASRPVVPPRFAGDGTPTRPQLLQAPIRWPRPSLLDEPLTRLDGIGPKLAEAAAEAGVPVGRFTAASLVTALASVIVLAVPLSIGSAIVVEQELIVARATPVVRQWAESQGGQISDISYREGSLRIVAIGRLPGIQDAGLREQLDQAGKADVDAEVTLVIGGIMELPGR